jgi:hypothetical protein
MYDNPTESDSKEGEIKTMTKKKLNNKQYFEESLRWHLRTKMKSMLSLVMAYWRAMNHVSRACSISG